MDWRRRVVIGSEIPSLSIHSHHEELFRERRHASTTPCPIPERSHPPLTEHLRSSGCMSSLIVISQSSARGILTVSDNGRPSLTCVR